MTKHLCIALGLAFLAGCYTAAATSTGSKTTDPGTTAATTDDPGFPCDVAKVLSDNCWSCHGSSPKGGAPSFATFEAFTASAGNGKTYADLAIERMRSSDNPMPPSGPIADDQISVIENWVSSGPSRDTCSDSSSSDNSNQTGDLSVYDTPETCTSKGTWKQSMGEGPLMQPGKACLSCHDGKSEAPLFGFAGTVYPTAHEPDWCNGQSPSGTTVVVTDSKGTDHTAKVNASGNFYMRGSISLPIKAKVVLSDGTTVREMGDAQNSGDCNSCHTDNGANNAPGRVMVPTAQ